MSQRAIALTVGLSQPTVSRILAASARATAARVEAVFGDSPADGPVMRDSAPTKVTIHATAATDSAPKEAASVGETMGPKVSAAADLAALEAVEHQQLVEAAGLVDPVERGRMLSRAADTRAKIARVRLAEERESGNSTKIDADTRQASKRAAQRLHDMIAAELAAAEPQRAEASAALARLVDLAGATPEVRALGARVRELVHLDA